MNSGPIVHGIFCTWEGCDYLNEIYQPDGGVRQFCEVCGCQLMTQSYCGEMMRGEFRVQLPRAKLPLLSSTANRLKKLGESELETDTETTRAAEALLSLKSSEANNVVKAEIRMEEMGKPKPRPGDQPGWIRMRDRRPLSDLQPRKLNFDSEEEDKSSEEKMVEEETSFFEGLDAVKTEAELRGYLRLGPSSPDPFALVTEADFAPFEEALAESNAENLANDAAQAANLFLGTEEDEKTRYAFPDS